MLQVMKSLRLLAVVLVACVGGSSGTPTYRYFSCEETARTEVAWNATPEGHHQSAQDALAPLFRHWTGTCGVLPIELDLAPRGQTVMSIALADDSDMECAPSYEAAVELTIQSGSATTRVAVGLAIYDEHDGAIALAGATQLSADGVWPSDAPVTDGVTLSMSSSLSDSGVMTGNLYWVGAETDAGPTFSAVCRLELHPET